METSLKLTSNHTNDKSLKYIYKLEKVCNYKKMSSSINHNSNNKSIVSIVSTRQDKIKLILAFYNEEYFLYSPDIYCKYSVYKVKVAIRYLKRILPYPVFTECLFDYLSTLIVKKNNHNCLIWHLKYFDCFNFKPSHQHPRDVHNFYKIITSRNRDDSRNSSHDGSHDVYRVLSIIATKSRYGVSYIMEYCDKNSTNTKVWLPKSCFSTISHSVGNPTRFDYTKHKVYFRVEEISEYNGHKYPVIVCNRYN